MTEQEMIDRVNAGQLDKAELKHLLVNITERTDTDRLREAIIQRLRTHHPAVARKMFGPKDQQARGMLEELRAELEGAHDLSKNVVGRHVKTGGDQIGGAKHVCVYISYRNEKGHAIQLALEQDEAGGEMYATVRSWEVREKGSERAQRFEAGEWSAACAAYRAQLPIVLGGSLPSRTP